LEVGAKSVRSCTRLERFLIPRHIQRHAGVADETMELRVPDCDSREMVSVDLQLSSKNIGSSELTVIRIAHELVARCPGCLRPAPVRADQSHCMLLNKLMVGFGLEGGSKSL
jgi:hypothetical protein